MNTLMMVRYTALAVAMWGAGCTAVQQAIYRGINGDLPLPAALAVGVFGVGVFAGSWWVASRVHAFGSAVVTGQTTVQEWDGSNPPSPWFDVKTFFIVWGTTFALNACLLVLSVPLPLMVAGGAIFWLWALWGIAATIICLTRRRR
ncbi:MAG: hypothetical protein OXE87_16650 [Chloroflexi bacterium]|nr:hypothetical protein [Chloroflexota bacterium]